MLWGNGGSLWLVYIGLVSVLGLSGGDISSSQTVVLLSHSPVALLSFSHTFLKPVRWPYCHCLHRFPSTLLCGIALMLLVSLPSLLVCPSECRAMTLRQLVSRRETGSFGARPASLPHAPQCTGDSYSREYTPCLFFYEAASSYSGQKPDKEKSSSRKQPLFFFLSSILIFASLPCLLLTLTETDKSKHFLNLNISPQCVIRGGCW